MGGEKANGSDAPDDDEGSPPRGRGKGAATVKPLKSVRITPAWAGKSQRTERTAESDKDHPRVGGEKVCSVWPHDLQQGSPPRRRGKALTVGEADGAVGITPA